MSQPKLWTKDFVIIFIVNFVLSVSVFIFMVIMSVYAIDKYDASISEAGLVTGVFVVGALLARLFIGRSIDRIGTKKTLFIGLTLNILAIALYLIDFGTIFLLITRFLNGITYGIASTAAGTIVAQIIPEARKGEGIGFFSMSTILAAAIGPFLGMYMTQNVSYQIIFLLCTLLAIICLTISYFVTVPTVEGNIEKSDGKELKLNFIERKTVPIALVILVLGFCYSGILTFLNYYAIENDLVQPASFFFVLYSIAILLSRPFTGRLMDRKGANYVMYPGFVLFTIGLLLLSSAQNGLMLLLSSIIIGLGFGNLQSCAQAIAIKGLPTHSVGLATSTFFIFIDIGMGFGPYLLGFIIPFISINNLYAFLAIFVIVSAALYFLLYGRKEKNMYNVTA
ncbi:MFS transporter [Neobacillus niacini]|uniref:MFS transporter n=1 Tax=Neobacillus niacini TaxID=86668 RepID=UPI003000FDCE